MNGRLLGAWVQGSVLGVLLFLALARLFTLSAGDALFRYQGF